MSSTPNITARELAGRAYIALQANAHMEAGLPLSHPMRVLWQVKPDGTRVLWLSPAGPGRGPASFYRRPTLGDCLLGEVRL